MNSAGRLLVVSVVIFQGKKIVMHDSIVQEGSEKQMVSSLFFGLHIVETGSLEVS